MGGKKFHHRKQPHDRFDFADMMSSDHYDRDFLNEMDVSGNLEFVGPEDNYAYM